MLLALIGAQGVIGYTQYFTGLPAGLVWFHVAGAAAIWVVAVRLLFTLRDRGRVDAARPAAMAAPGEALDRLRAVPGQPAVADAAAAPSVLRAAARWRAEPRGGRSARHRHRRARRLRQVHHRRRGRRAAGAALVHTDDFFQPPSAAPRARQPPGTLPGQALERYYDWRRLRAQALEPLRARRPAAFRRFDWERGGGLDGLVTVAPRDLILVEGVFSAAPQLSDLVNRSVFVDTPEPERLRRLRRRVTRRNGRRTG